VFSFYRFIVNRDYIISYEGTCDPYINACFQGCEGDNCEKEYYYSKVQKYAADLHKECGNNIIGCEAANICLANDRECSVTYCNTEVDGYICKTPTKETNTESSELFEPSKEEILKNDNNAI
jgi:hypothetical protein